MAEERIGDAGRASEKNLSKDLGGSLTRGSGSGNEKGDVKVSGFLIEAKSTVNKSMSVKLDWLNKIVNEAIMTDREPGFSIRFTNDRGDVMQNGDWVAVPRRVWEDLVEDEDD